MKEKLGNIAFVFGFLVFEFWPLVIVPAVIEIFETKWAFGWFWLWYIPIGAASWLIWDWADGDDENSMSLVFGWRKRHPKKEYRGYQAD